MLYQSSTTPPPPAPDIDTQKRWAHQGLRKRMLVGNWSQDLEDEIGRHIGSNSDRRAVWGVSDLSSNVFRSISQALSALYNEGAPAISSPSPADELLGPTGLIQRASLWPLMQRVQMLTVGMREMFMRVDIADDGLNLLYRPVTPDLVWAISPAGAPMEPIKLMELRLRAREGGELQWCYDVFDLSDLANPIYEVRAVGPSGVLGDDLSGEFLGGPMSGASYPYRESTGRPRLPYTIYHAQITGELFDSFTGSELLFGSLTAACLNTFLVHLIRDCAWPQRWVMGCGLAGASLFDADSTARRASISSDPASILVFTPDEAIQGLGSPMVGQFQAGGDEEKLMASITSYERKLAQSAGLSPASIQKISGDPRSGYAIAMSRSDQRDAQRRYTPAMKRGDINTLELSAIIANRFLGSSFPESGFKIKYASIPLSKEESETLRRDVIEKVEKNLITKIDAIRMLQPDLTVDEAAQYLREIRRQNIEFV